MNARLWMVVALVAVVVVGALTFVPGVGAQERTGSGSGLMDCTGPRTGGMGGPGQGRGIGMRMGDPSESLVAVAAEQLGMTVDEVRAALSSGKTIEDLAEEKGVEPQAIVDEVLALRKARLDALVADGKLTQDQADTMLAQMAEHLAERIGQSFEPGQGGGTRPGRGQAPGRGRGRA